MKSRIMYIELKSGYADNGPAYIGRVTFSKTGKTLYYRDKSFRSCKGNGIKGNYFDLETGDEYWISGCKKNGQDRHRCGCGEVVIDDDAKAEYRTEIRKISQNIK